jgi:hypothetical protein
MGGWSMKKHVITTNYDENLLNTNEVISDYEFLYKVVMLGQKFDFENNRSLDAA